MADIQSSMGDSGGLGSMGGMSAPWDAKGKPLGKLQRDPGGGAKLGDL